MSADAVEAEIGLKVPPKKKYILTKDKVAKPIGEKTSIPHADAEHILGDGPDLYGFHEPLMALTWRLAHSKINDPQADVEQELKILERAVLDAPNLTSRNMAQYGLEEIRRYYEDAVRKINAEQAQRRAQVQPAAPFHNEPLLPKEEALMAVENTIAGWTKGAVEYQAVQQGNMRWDADDSPKSHTIEEALLHISNPRYKAMRPTKMTLAASTGTGKTRALIQSLIKHGQLTKNRFYLFAPNYVLAHQWQRDFGAAANEMQSDATARLIIGLDPTKGAVKHIRCKDKIVEPVCVTTDELTLTRIKQARNSNGSLTVQEAACTLCPHKDGCAYQEQLEDTSPGLIICVQAYLTANAIPGLKKSQFEPTVQLESFEGKNDIGPLLGFAVDERLNLNKEARCTLSANFKSADMNEIIWRLKSVINASSGAKISRQALTNEGIYGFKELNGEKGRLAQMGAPSCV